jgi:hypothetical protein
MQKKLLSPRGYLSPSQVLMFTTNPSKYYSRYMLGEDDYTTKEMSFGGIIAKCLEDKEKTGDLFTDMVLSKLTKLPLSEIQLTTPMSSPFGEINLLGRLDGYDEMIENLTVGEYKTGKVAWTQKKVDESIQLLHYATMAYLKTGKIPKVWLEWAETENSDYNKIVFTGKIIHFDMNINLSSIIKYMALVTKVAVAIDKMYRNYLNENTIKTEMA